MFYACFSLGTVYLPDTIEKIGDRAFSRCVSLSSVHVPRILHTLGNHAFADCRRLHSVSLPTTLKRIGNHAFDGCVGLHTVLLPDCYTMMGESVFLGCDNLRILVTADDHPLFRHRRERWAVPKDVQIILHSELSLALLFSELTDAQTTPERKQEIRAAMRRRLTRVKRGNHQHSTAAIRDNFYHIMDAIGAQISLDDEA